MTTRRGFLAGLGALLAAPAIVKAEILMPVKPVIWTPQFVMPPGQIVTELENGWYRVSRIVESHYGSVMVKPVGGVQFPHIIFDERGMSFDFSHLNDGKGLLVSDETPLPAGAIRELHVCNTQVEKLTR